MDIPSPYGIQIKYSLFQCSRVERDSLFISTPSGKTLAIDMLKHKQISGHLYFDIEPVRGSDEVVLLTGKPNERGYVASKTLSLYNVVSKEYILLGTYEKATTKAHDVSVRDGIAYVLLYDDRRNRPLLQRVGLEGGKVFRI